MKSIKRLPYVLAFAFAILVGACSEIEIDPVGAEDDTKPLVQPPKTNSQSTSGYDTLAIGG